jgi:hypothetical protein
MDQLSSEIDLCRERPSRRSRLPVCRPTRAIGTRRRTLPLWGRKRLSAKVRVARTVDLPNLEGDPSYRADEGLFRLGAAIRPFEIRLGLIVTLRPRRSKASP